MEGRIVVRCWTRASDSLGEGQYIRRRSAPRYSTAHRKDAAVRRGFPWRWPVAVAPLDGRLRIGAFASGTVRQWAGWGRVLSVPYSGIRVIIGGILRLWLCRRRSLEGVHYGANPLFSPRIQEPSTPPTPSHFVSSFPPFSPLSPLYSIIRFIMRFLHYLLIIA